MRDTSLEKGSEDPDDIVSSSQSEEESESEDSNGLPASALQPCQYSMLWLMSNEEGSDFKLGDRDLTGERQVVGKSRVSCLCRYKHRDKDCLFLSYIPRRKYHAFGAKAEVSKDIKTGRVYRV